MSYYTQPFAPDYSKGVTVVPGVASAVQSFPNNANAVEFTNLSTTVRASVRFGETNAVTADLSADYTIMPGMKCVITKPRNYQFFAFICSAAGGSLHAIPGEGF
jgi:hypothetical protein